MTPGYTPPPTPQQQAAIDAALAGHPVVVIRALAGTGKTTLFVQQADRFADYGIGGAYTALNRAVAGEVGARFTRGNIAPMTIHSLAWTLAKANPDIAPLLDKLDSPNAVPRWQLARYLQFAEVMTYTGFTDTTAATVHGAPGSRSTTLTANQIIGHCLSTIRAWCSSADEVMDTSHVGRVSGMPGTFHDAVFAPRVAELSRQLWEMDICNPQGRVPFTHDHYLKMVSLTHPDLTTIWPAGSLLFVDEAQDARPAMLSIIRDQVGRMRIIAVGDSSQAINRFTGARDALPELAAIPGAVTLPLTQSFRFGPASAALANRILRMLGEELEVQGNPALDTTVYTYDPEGRAPEADAVLVRTNARLIQEVTAEVTSGRRVHAVVDSDYITRVMEDVERICGGDFGHSRDLRHLASRGELTAFCDPATGQAGDLGPLLRLALDLGPRRVIGILGTCVDDPADADVVVTTIHKAKGREWPRVRLAVSPYEIIPGMSERIPSLMATGGVPGDEARDALMLLYVAVTRGSAVTHIPADTMEALGDVELLAARPAVL